MRKSILLFVLFTLTSIPLLLFAQGGYQVTGHIISAEDNQPMIGVSHPGSPQPDGRRRRDRSQPYVYADAGRRKAGFGHDYLGIHRSIPLAPAYAPGVHDADQQQIPVK